MGSVLSGNARFLGICFVFFVREAAEVGSGKGSWAAFLSGFARIFGFLDGRGRVEGLDGVSPLPPVHGLADGLGGWLRLLAGWGCWLRSSSCFFFKFKTISKK